MDFTSSISIGPKKRRRYLIFGLILIIFVIVFLIWNFFLAGPSEPSLFQPILPPEIKINFEILESSALNELQLYEEISPFEGEIGRENPFIPY